MTTKWNEIVCVDCTEFEEQYAAIAAEHARYSTGIEYAAIAAEHTRYSTGTEYAAIAAEHARYEMNG